MRTATEIPPLTLAPEIQRAQAASDAFLSQAMLRRRAQSSPSSAHHPRRLVRLEAEVFEDGEAFLIG